MGDYWPRTEFRIPDEVFRRKENFYYTEEVFTPRAGKFAMRSKQPIRSIQLDKFSFVVDIESAVLVVVFLMSTIRDLQVSLSEIKCLSYPFL